MTAAAALVVLGGLGFALSTVSDTVTSPPTPGGTAQVLVPKAQTAQPLPPSAPATTKPPSGATSPAAAPPHTSLPTGTGQDLDHDQKNERENRGPQDGDDADG
ncbi:hypothetical protein [Streptomyces sp. MAI_2237]